MSKERALQRRILAWLAKRPDIWWLKVHGGSAYQRAGIPDLLCSVGGVLVAAELKAPGEVPTPTQWLELEGLKASGAVVGVVYSVAEFAALVASAEARSS